MPFGQRGFGLRASKGMLWVEDDAKNRALVVALGGEVGEMDRDYGVCYKIGGTGRVTVDVLKNTKLQGVEAYPAFRTCVTYSPLVINHITKIPLHLFVYAGGFG